MYKVVCRCNLVINVLPSLAFNKKQAVINGVYVEKDKGQLVATLFESSLPEY